MRPSASSFSLPHQPGVAGSVTGGDWWIRTHASTAADHGTTGTRSVGETEKLRFRPRPVGPDERVFRLFPVPAAIR